MYDTPPKSQATFGVNLSLSATVQALQATTPLPPKHKNYRNVKNGDRNVFRILAKCRSVLFLAHVRTSELEHVEEEKRKPWNVNCQGKNIK